MSLKDTLLFCFSKQVHTHNYCGKTCCSWCCRKLQDFMAWILSAAERPVRRLITLVRTTSRVWIADLRLHLPTHTFLYNIGHTQSYFPSHWEFFGCFNIHQSVRGNFISHGCQKTLTHANTLLLSLTHTLYLCLHTHILIGTHRKTSVENFVMCPRSIFVTADSFPRQRLKPGCNEPASHRVWD